MAKNMKRRAAAPSQHRYPREARLNQSLRQVIAEELVAIDDEHLDLVTITSIDVDPEMNRAIVFFDSLNGEEADAEILEALTRYRVRLQSSVARQIRSKKTPILEFRPDEVIRSAERIERILRDNPSPAVNESNLDESSIDGDDDNVNEVAVLDIADGPA